MKNNSKKKSFGINSYQKPRLVKYSLKDIEKDLASLEVHCQKGGLRDWGVASGDTACCI